MQRACHAVKDLNRADFPVFLEVVIKAERATGRQHPAGLGDGARHKQSSRLCWAVFGCVAPRQAQCEDASSGVGRDEFQVCTQMLGQLF